MGDFFFKDVFPLLITWFSCTAAASALNRSIMYIETKFFPQEAHKKIKQSGNFLFETWSMLLELLMNISGGTVQENSQINWLLLV